MNKTHVPDFPIIGRQYHNHQVSLHFCAIHSAGQSDGSSVKMSTRRSAGSSVGMSTGRSARSSSRNRNVVRFFAVTPEKCELDLGNHKT
jgi:hypothetical protein